MTNDIRLIAIDIDGTLLDSHFQVTAANMEALKRAHSEGIEIALVTGRRHSFALPIAEALGFPVTLVSSNGAVTRRSTGELFHQDLMPAATAVGLLRHMSEFRHYTVVTFDRPHKGALVVESVDELNRSIQRWMEKNAEYIEQRQPLESAVTEAPIQAMFCGTIEKMQEAQQHLLLWNAITTVTVLRTQYEERDLCIVDTLNAGCSKGHALKRWAEECGYRREQVMAIGDNYNDIEMLEYSGHPVVMANASADMKRDGWAVTLSNNESGVAAAVNRILP